MSVRHALLLGCLLACSRPALGQLSVLGLDPAQNASGVAADVRFVVDFDRPVDPATLPPATDQWRFFGTNSGPLSGSFTLENGGTRVRFTPSSRLFPGEQVRVTIGSGVAGTDGVALRAAGFHYDVRIGASPARREFALVQTATTVTSTDTRIYGGQASDLDGDGACDLAIVNEVSDDVRVLLNLGGRSGTFAPVLQPVNPVGAIPSPSELADLNGDGFSDLVTGNTGGGDLSLLFGNGDGTFQPVVNVPVGSSPREVVALDVDGDADTDLVCANVNSSNLALLLNDGTGSFAAATFFEGGGNVEWGLGASDMNGDGILDLVVGMRTEEVLVVHLGNGDGTFTAGPAFPSGARSWMVVLGDVNGDGATDVSTTSGTDLVNIVLGDGAGGLLPPRTLSTGGSGFTVATDLGDLDGDGDLDWVVSDFGSGEWFVFENDGAGVFSFDQSLPAATNPGCALIFDTDEDGDLDLVLLDETSDLIFVHENRFAGTEVCNGDGGETPGCTSCPCGNDAPPGTVGGCLNGAVRSARLSGSGVPSAGADSMRFTLEGASSSSFAVLVSAADLLPAVGPCPPGAGVTSVFFDGLRCAGGGLVRHGTRATDALGATTAGWGPGLLAQGGFGAGETRSYQVIYRTAPGEQCGTGQNTSQALVVLTLP